MTSNDLFRGVYPCTRCRNLAVTYYPGPDEYSCRYCGVKTNGTNWRTDQRDYSSSVTQPYSSPLAELTYASQIKALTDAYHQASDNGAHPSQLAAIREEVYRLEMSQKSFLRAKTASAPPPVPKKLPASVLVGEIVAWRVWRITSNCILQSGYTSNIWLPSLPMHGNPKESGRGVHAFKDTSTVLLSAAKEYGSDSHGSAIGAVYLWGTVIEHETGYRAEWASVKSIVSVFGVHGSKVRSTLSTLREAYGVA